MRTYMVTAPAVEPVTVDEIKEHCVIGNDDDNSILRRLVKVARMGGETFIEHQFVTATRETTWDSWGVSSDIELPYPPLQSVTSVTYVDDDDVLRTISTDDYEVVTAGIVGFVRPVDEWPTGKTLTVRYVCGWPLVDGEPTTPEDIRHWIMVRVADLYEHRESFIVGQPINVIPSNFVDGLISHYRLPAVV